MRTTRRRRMVLAAAVAATLFGCGVDRGPETVTREDQALMFWQPQFKQLVFELVGRGLNGTSLSGEPLEGRLVVAVSLEGVEVPKGAAKDLTLKRTLFYGSHVKGKIPAAKPIVGARFTAYLDDGTPLTLRIDSASAVEDPSGDYAHYEVSYASQDGWLPLCGLDEAGAPVPAIPLTGVWNYERGTEGGGDWLPSDTTFTFACEGFVLAKCVALGYAPWAQGSLCPADGKHKECEKTTLRAHHQACTRAMRADFCGDGTSYTVDGVELNLYDGIGVRLDSEDWALEAEWDAEGARCAVAERVGSLPLPGCLADLADDACGDEAHFDSGTLLMTETNDSL